MGTRANCWEVRSCGREPGGARAGELGVCPAATDTTAAGVNGGHNAGRVCWAVTGTLCRGAVAGTFAQKQFTCVECGFFSQVQAEEAESFRLLPTVGPALEALRESEAKAHAAFDGVPVGLFRSSNDGVLLLANDAWAACLGIEAGASLVGQSLAGFFARPADAERWSTDLLRDGLVRGFEVEVRRADGTAGWVSLAGRPMFCAAGSPAYIEGSAQDITQRVRLEAELAQVRAERDRMTQMLVHDMRSSMTALRMFVDAAALSAQGTMSLESLIEPARRTVQSVLDLTDSLLDVARLEAGEPLLVREPLDLRPVISEVLVRTRLSAGARALLAEVPEEPVWVAGDADMLRRVVQNLVDNAVKHTDSRSGQIDVVLEVEPNGISMSVADNGHGLSAADRERVFERFFSKSEAHRRGVRSTGLGLTFAKLAIEAHGGCITVDEASGGGARFRARLPRLEAAVA